MPTLQIESLTPEILAELQKLTNEEEVIAYFKKKGYDVSKDLAKRVLDGIKGDQMELTDEELKMVSGGGCGGKTTKS